MPGLVPGGFHPWDETGGYWQREHLSDSRAAPGADYRLQLYRIDYCYAGGEVEVSDVYVIVDGEAVLDRGDMARLVADISAVADNL